MTGVQWDEDKRRRNIDDHGVDFRLAALIFNNPVIEASDQRGDYGETRYCAPGHVGDEYFLVAFRGAAAHQRLKGRR